MSAPSVSAPATSTASGSPGDAASAAIAPRRYITLDANEAVAAVAHKLSEVVALYPITPSSPMAESCDEWSAKGKKNIWGQVPKIIQMQSEAGVAGTVHGALQAGALATTFTASQGLLLMVPNMYKIAGELLPFVMHVTARAVATHALSIFGDHSDVMACRATGFAMLCSNSVQEAQDLALIAHAVTLDSRIPFLHFFDGFRTSHEVSKIEPLSDEVIRTMVNENSLAAFRARALTPDHPTVRGTAQNPDAFFQAREAANLYYQRAPGLIVDTMNRFAELTGRKYRLFDYVGDPEASRVMVIMGSGAETAEETVNHLVKEGHKVGLLKVRLYRPWSNTDFMAAIPRTAKYIAVLDRTKEPGAIGEPLYLDVVAAMHEAMERANPPMAKEPAVIGVRYGLGSKEFTPAMVAAVFHKLEQEGSMPRKLHRTVGIVDDVTHLSIPVDESFDVEADDVARAVFFGLGSDGTVGANKNSIKIIGEETAQFAQGYFVYDSKKSGAITISHLRFGPRPIRAAYLIKKARFVACHHFGFLERYDVCEMAAKGATLLLNSPYAPEVLWDQLPAKVRRAIIEKNLKLFAINADDVARATGMGGRINTIMQTCFFALADVMPVDKAIGAIKKAIQKTYGKRGPEVVAKNCAAVDEALAHLKEVDVPRTAEALAATQEIVLPIPTEMPTFVKRVTAVMMAGQGDLLPVSAFPVDGTWPVGTSKWEKRSIATEVPIWEPELCIQCNKCALVCPHSAIRPKAYDASELDEAPEGFKHVPYKAADLRGLEYTLQLAPDDCTGCQLCVQICPAKDKKTEGRKAINMQPIEPHREREREWFDHFMSIPDVDRSKLVRVDAKASQFMRPLFEFSGACAGCGETPYVRVLTQLLGDRLMIANATGCSSIYGGNLPTTPYTTDEHGHGPAWCNSLFEDNAEFGLGFRLAVDSLEDAAREFTRRLATQVGEPLATELLTAKQDTEAEIDAQRQRVARLLVRIAAIDSPDARRLQSVAEYLVRKSVWVLGGDGWAYDIGFGGLDHLFAINRNVKILVLDTEVYSNTGGQQSKSTPLGATAKFAAAGKRIAKKDLGRIAMTYGHCYVAQIAVGANDNQAVKAFQEAESFPGTALIIAYSHCLAHGYEICGGLGHQQLAVDAGVWPLYRFDPRRVAEGKPALQLDSKPPTAKVRDYMLGENRFKVVQAADPATFDALVAEAQREAEQKHAAYRQLAGLS